MSPESTGTPRLVLASQSPRRRELLERIGCRPDVRPVDADESVGPGEKARDLVQRLARTKATAIEVGPDEVVVAADTEVALDGTSFGKPADLADAAAMLRRLSGRPHQVHTGVAVRLGDRIAVGVSDVTVVMRPLDEALIDWYLSTGEPLGKAGAYALQGAGGLLVRSLEGSPDAVVGLPLALVDELAAEVGVELRDLTHGTASNGPASNGTASNGTASNGATP
ncbi:MAG: Maf family protein [Acidimicrobiales bacterium]